MFGVRDFMYIFRRKETVIGDGVGEEDIDSFEGGPCNGDAWWENVLPTIERA